MFRDICNDKSISISTGMLDAEIFIRLFVSCVYTQIYVML